jgi:hypothetical protein
LSGEPVTIEKSPQSPEPTGERKLLAAIIGRAVDDVRFACKPICRRALEWSRIEGGAFDQYCMALGLEPEALKAGMEKLNRARVRKT